MSEQLLGQVAADLNHAPDTASRAARMAAAVTEINSRIADEALRQMPFDSSPYAYQAWLAQTDRC